MLVVLAVAGTLALDLTAVLTHISSGARPLAAVAESRVHAQRIMPETSRHAARHRPVPAWVKVPVATVWTGPHRGRPVDRLLMSARPDVPRWLRHQSVPQRLRIERYTMTQALFGDAVRVLTRRRGWSEIELPSQRGGAFPHGIVGWVPNEQLTTTAPAAAGTTATVTTPVVVLRSAKGRPVVRVSVGTRLPVLRRAGRDVVLSTPGYGALHAPASAVTVAARRSGDAVVRAARRLLGVPYLWAGVSAYGLDCSGLTMIAYREIGITLPRDAADQARWGHPVARRALRPGDLVFFGPTSRHSIHHVGIYVGHGRMLHAPHTGARVRISRLGALSDYWGARRYVRTHA